MKFSLALGTARPLSRSEARGCLTANLALPGSGSLVAGRAVGYFQMGFYLVGFLISLVGVITCLHWYLANQNSMDTENQANPFASMASLFQHLFVPVIGVAICVFALSWAIVTSLQILKDSAQDPAPPIIR